MEAVEVRAAGGVVVRQGDAGQVEIALIHRPQYQDWSFPKGKLVPGESFEAAALREVEEETGLICRLGRPLGRSRYRDRRGREKLVRYWVMHPIAGTFAPNAEVDVLHWYSVPDAVRMLTYPRDRRILQELDPVVAGA